MECRSGVDAQSDRYVNRVTPPETPAREIERLLDGLTGLARPANQKDPERSESVLFDALGNLAHFRRREAFLQLFENCIAGALGCDSQRAESCRPHCAQQLGGGDCRREIRRIQLDVELPALDCLAYLQRVTRWGIESGIDEVEMPDACVAIELLDLVSDALRIAGAVSPALDVPVGAVHALVYAAALCLNGNGRTVPLVAREIDPAMERWRRKGIEVRFLAGRSESDASVLVTHQAGKRLDRRSRRHCIDERDTRALAVAGNRVIDAEIAEERFRSDSKGCSARDDLCARRRAPQALKNVARLRRVVPERDRIAVVDVSHRDADDVRIEAPCCVRRG